MVNIKEIKDWTPIKALDDITDPSEQNLHIARHLLYTLNPKTILSEYKIIGEALINNVKNYKDAQKLVKFYEKNNSNSNSAVSEKELSLIKRIEELGSYKWAKQAIKSYENLTKTHYLLEQYIKEKGLIKNES
jgi:hypothetical protein